jgi:hypothetical protein
MDLTFSLQDSRTWATWPVIFSNLDSMVVTFENKLVVFSPCHICRDVMSLQA